MSSALEDRDKDRLYIAVEDAIYRYLEAYDPGERQAIEDFASPVIERLVQASRDIEQGLLVGDQLTLNAGESGTLSSP